MDERQQAILTKSLKYLSDKIRVGNVVQKTCELYPGIITKEHLEEMQTKSGEPRLAYVLGIFKAHVDGYEQLFQVLNKTGHRENVLNILRPGLNLQTLGVAIPSSSASPGSGTSDSTAEILKQLQSISMKITQSDQVVQSMSRNMASSQQVQKMETKIDKLSSAITGLEEKMRKKFEMIEKRLDSFGEANENLKEALDTLAEEVKKFKNDYAQFVDTYHKSKHMTESREYESFKTIVEKLAVLDGSDKDRIWQEINDLREKVNSLRKITETVWRTMQTSPSQEIVQDDDVHVLAQKMKTIWRPLGQKVGVNITDLEGGECKMDVEGRAVAVLTRWLSKRDSGLMWEDFISVVSEIDENVADTIAELRSSNP